MSRSIPEVRYSRRALTVLYILFVVGLCVCTSVSIISTLREQTTAPKDLPKLEGPARTVDARALSDLRTLFEELRTRGENVGRANLNRAIDLAKWDAWGLRWRERMNRLGEKYNLVAKGKREGELAGALHTAYHGSLKLLSAYDLAAKNLAYARANALDIHKELDRARDAVHK
jgi:hypothetical protein